MNMKQQIFHPFEDRFSRDMRNDLSSALAEAVETGNTGKLDALQKEFNHRELADCYRDYLQDRSTRYEKALQLIHSDQHPIQQAVILWNQGLFFEVHEVLEHAWYHAKGDTKLTLQALIRAAGVYVKLEYGYIDAAHKIAGKSWPVLEKNSNVLETFFDPEPLIKALKAPEKKAPQLTPPSQINS
jgi:hypothetical protein